MLVKKQLPPKLTAVFESFPKALLDTHGKDLVASTATPTASGQATPAAGGASTPAAAPAPAAAPSSLPSKPAAKKSVNTSTIRVEAQFMVSAADLFGYLTDETRIPAWTRAPAKVSSNFPRW